MKRVFATAAMRDQGRRPLSQGQQLTNDYCRVLGADVAKGAQESRLTKSRLEKFAKEGAAFLCTCNSGKPVAFIGVIAFRQRPGQNQLSDVCSPMGTEHARKLRKYFLSFRIQIENPIHQGHVNAFVCQGKTFSIALLKLEMRQVDNFFRRARASQHSFTKVDSDNPPGWSYSPRGNYRVHTRATTEIENSGADRQICEQRNV
jgi:hypothetical protein